MTLMKGDIALTRREELARIIEELIDDSKVSWVKSAFYSDPEVADIVSTILERWEREGKKGKPIDYASEEELEILANYARNYAFLVEEEARALMYTRLTGMGAPPSDVSLATLLKEFRSRKK